MSTPEGAPDVRRGHHGWLLPLIAALGAAQARADEPLWEFGMGLGLLRLPHYRGSDQRQDWLLPTPYFVYRGEVFRADREGARALLVDAERFDLDVSVAATAPTRSKDNQARQGMPDLAPTFELGPNLNLLLGRGAGWKMQLRLPVRAAFTIESSPQSIGWLATPNLNVDWRVNGWNLGLLGGPIIATRRFNGYFYDVQAPFATATRPTYRAPGGAGGWRVVGGVSRRVGDWWMGAFAAADAVGGARFEPSPLVRQHNTVAFGLAFSYVFEASSQRVSRAD